MLQYVNQDYSFNGASNINEETVASFYASFNKSNNTIGSINISFNIVDPVKYIANQAAVDADFDEFKEAVILEVEEEA